MSRFLCLALAIASAALAAESPEHRILDARRHHLGVAGMPEWEEFAASAPEGTQLALDFSAAANASEATLFIRQRDVKTTWNVVLNGRRLGALETLSQSLVLVLAIPAGTLQDGANHLIITRSPTRLLDDIVVGEFALELRPRDDALSAAAIEVSVTDADSGGTLPCRLTLVDPEQALAPLRAEGGQHLAVRTGVIYTGDGRARFSAPAGTYDLYASRGFEYSVAKERFTMRAGAKKSFALKLRREVPTPGLVACDSHIHTLTFSKHGDATIDERMLTIAGEGIELAVATDHNHHTDYAEPAAQNGVSAHFTSVVGNEITTSVGHFNAFPVPAAGPIPNPKLTDWTQLLHEVRRVTGAQVVTLNHPRDLHENFIPFSPDNFDPTTGELKKVANFDCDAVEVVTSAAVQSDVMLLFHDWFALLNHGYHIAACAASDTHQVSEFILGQARTYVACRSDQPATIDVNEVCASYRTGRLLVSMGLLTQMTLDGKFGVGDLATGLGRELVVNAEVFGPSWVTADRVELFANGVKIAEQAIVPTERALKTRATWKIPRPKHDVHLVAIATGPGITAPYWETPHPYQPSSKVFRPRIVGATNPIWIDGDGDGKFTPAREYAAKLLAASGADDAKLKAALRDYDEAVATQARALMHR